MEPKRKILENSAEEASLNLSKEDLKDLLQELQKRSEQQSYEKAKNELEEATFVENLGEFVKKLEGMKGFEIMKENLMNIFEKYRGDISKVASESKLEIIQSFFKSEENVEALTLSQRGKLEQYQQSNYHEKLKMLKEVFPSIEDVIEVRKRDAIVQMMKKKDAADGFTNGERKKRYSEKLGEKNE